MELAVDGAGVGYYARGARKLGGGGDFVPAPELGPLFGRPLARELRPFDRILEIGAGSGALADVLADGREYLILETSADLIRRQKEKLGNRVQHIQHLPAGFHGAVKARGQGLDMLDAIADRKSTRLNSSHQIISYAVFFLKKKKYSPAELSPFRPTS